MTSRTHCRLSWIFALRLCRRGAVAGRGSREGLGCLGKEGGVGGMMVASPRNREMEHAHGGFYTDRHIRRAVPHFRVWWKGTSEPDHSFEVQPPSMTRQKKIKLALMALVGVALVGIGLLLSDKVDWHAL